MKSSFAFLDPGELVDQELELELTAKVYADDERGFVPVYDFRMVNRQTGEKMGIIGLRIGNNENLYYGGHIGYGVDELFRGHHYAARSVKLLFSLAKMHGLNPFFITCNPDNIASRKTCEAAGGKLIEIVDLPVTNDQYLMGERQKCRYRFDL